MSYPQLTTEDGIVTVTPELLRDIGKQLPAQIAKMSLQEIFALGLAVKELAQTTTVSRMAALIKRK